MVGKSKWNAMNYKQRDQNRCDVCGNVAAETLYKFQCEDSEFKLTIYAMIKQAATNYEGCIETADDHKQGDRSRTTNENKAKQSHKLVKWGEITASSAKHMCDNYIWMVQEKGPQRWARASGTL